MFTVFVVWEYIPSDDRDELENIFATKAKAEMFIKDKPKGKYSIQEIKVN